MSDEGAVMPDYGHDLRFGTFLPPVAEHADAVVALARLAERLGLDSVSVQDHPYQPAFLDTWTLLSVLAARTSRIRLFPNVANLPLRPPAVLARSAASLDILSGGRVELGLGAGSFWDAIAANGGPRRAPAEAVDALEEAIAVIRALWTPGRAARVAGEHHRLDGAKPGPFPAHDMGIWLGAYKKRMLRLTGRAADGWLPSSPYAPPERLAEMNAVIDDAAREAGRDPAAIRRIYNITGSFSGTGAEFLQGPPRVWVEQLAELALTEGIGEFVLMADAGDDTGLRRFADEVAPGVREQVGAEHGAATDPVPTRPPPPPAPARPAAGLGPAAGSPAGVRPTPPPETRLSGEAVWDESTRPSGPIAGGGPLPATANPSGRHLIDVHDHLRGELAQLRDLIRQVAEGGVDVAAARDMIATMTMRQNSWTLGTYCESYCRVVTTHHTLEDRSVFPWLRKADPRLAPVIDRLAEEHEAIAGVLERVDRALVAMVADPARIGDVQDAVDLLTDTLLSHLSYEERELVEPLGRHGFSDAIR
ncbi:LLM class flavin-dependent oxidoreductase [Nocardiopsis mangrovi]|uniref:LLM class flavin-dependent oxidoreductase n=1 Tax=Nocardiopsis mangrovi TaxID=1179818 RepID=A0ABV9DWT6_9ACTN